jgi:hypothetical protein
MRLVALIEVRDYDCGNGLVYVDAGVDGDGEFVQVCCSSPREQFQSRSGVGRKLGPHAPNS